MYSKLSPRLQRNQLTIQNRPPEILDLEKRCSIYVLSLSRHLTSNFERLHYCMESLNESFFVGKRFLVVNENLWLKEIAQILANEFKSRGEQHYFVLINQTGPILGRG